MQIRIITPERTVLEMEEVDHVLLPAAGGEMGVLPGHIASVVQLAVGRVEVDHGEDEQPVMLATSGGFAEILEDQVTVLAETAEMAEEIDLERAQRARDRAEELLQRRDAEVDDASIRASLSRAMNRIHIARD